MESPIPTRASDPEKMALLRTAASEAAQLKAKGGCPGLPSGLCSSCPVDPGRKLVPSVGLSFLVCERDCLGSTTLCTWAPHELVGQDNPWSAVQMWATRQGQVVPDSLP